MTDWRSVTDILEDMHKHKITASKAIDWAKALIDIGKAAERAAEQEKRLREARDAALEAEAVKVDWIAILGGDR
jgi:translation initiation factor 2B subunit (eIF-2B alpha/beta/delta family)